MPGGALAPRFLVSHSPKRVNARKAGRGETAAAVSPYINKVRKDHNLKANRYAIGYSSVRGCRIVVATPTTGRTAVRSTST